jgi:hypothetical protein
MTEQNREGSVARCQPATASGQRAADSTEVVHRTVDERNESVSTAVVEALAEAEGVSPPELDQPLYESVDPDALDRVLSREGRVHRRGRIEFSVSGRRVAVTVEEDVYVCVYAEP